MNEQGQANQDTAITLIELQNMLTVVDLASSRGAFRGPELEQIGQLYNKFKRFVDSAAQRTAEEGVKGD